MERPPLSRGHQVVAGAQVSLAVVFAAVGFFDSGGGDGWSDLTRLVIALIAGLYLLATATVTAVGRYLVRRSGVRYGLFVLGPPLLMAIAILLIRVV